MEKNTKILIGVAAAGVVAYLVLKPKKAVAVENKAEKYPNDFPDTSKILSNHINPIPYGQENNFIYKYKVVKPISFGSGSFSDNTSFDSLAPKVGDIIQTNAPVVLPKYMAGGGIVYLYQICITPLYHNIQDKECHDVWIDYDALENLGQIIYT
jgi:hypothetical protein